MLSETFTTEVLDKHLPIEDWTLGQWMGALRRGWINRLTPFLNLSGTAWRRNLIRNRTYKVRGCNMAVWRSDFLRVDGFDAAFIGWGHEDYDLAARLQMTGVRLKDGRWATGVLHLWHSPADRMLEEMHWDSISAKVSAKRLSAERGYSTLQN